jgi:hypothetical protein
VLFSLIIYNILIAVGNNDYFLILRIVFGSIAVLAGLVRMGVEISSKEECGYTVFIICICLLDIGLTAAQLAL